MINILLLYVVITVLWAAESMIVEAIKTFKTNKDKRPYSLDELMEDMGWFEVKTSPLWPILATAFVLIVCGKFCEKYVMNRNAVTNILLEIRKPLSKIKF